MQLIDKDTFGQKYCWPVISLLFFTASYLFLFLAVKVELIFYYFLLCRKTPIFKSSAPFLLDWLRLPGGLSQYIGCLLTQLCYFPWLGTLLIILICLGIYLLFVLLLDIKKDSFLHIVCFVPAIIILMICSRYETPLNITVAVLFVMLVAVAYQKVSISSGWFRSVVFIICSGVGYYLAGVAVLIFVVAAAAYELFEHRKLSFCVIYLILGTIICLLSGAVIFRMNEGNSYLSFIPLFQINQIVQQEKMSKYLSIVLFAFLPTAVLIINISRLMIMKMSGSGLVGRHSKEEPINKEKTDDIPGWVLQAVFFVVIAVSCILFSYDRTVKNTIGVNYFTNQRMWPEVLSIVRNGQLKRYYPYCNNAVNRALFHTGRLGDEMFTFPQSQNESDLVFNRQQFYNVSYMERPEVCLELGMVNAAEEIAYEYLAGTDDNPYILKQLALINMVKGQIETARVFINVLKLYPAFAKEAKDLLIRLENDPRLEIDKQIQYLRSVMENNDVTYVAYDEETWLKMLLNRNKKNKMAFEYLMAHYLLNGQLEQFVENLHRLDDFGYEKIPRHYQEAILLYAGTTGKQVDLGSRAIDGEVVALYNEINKIAMDSGIKDLSIMRKILEPKYSNTYFFYYTFAYSK